MQSAKNGSSRNLKRQADRLGYKLVPVADVATL